MKKLKDFPRGATIPFAGHEWIVLETSADDAGATLVLMKDVLETKAFDEGNNADWRNSSARNYLNGAVLDNIQFAAGPGGCGMILSFTRDIMAADGTFRESCEDTVSLLTLDEYRRNRDVIEPIDAWWWLITRDSASHSCYVRHVNTDGSLHVSLAYYGFGGLRPALTLDSDLLIPEASDTDADHLGEILTAAAKSSGFSIQQIIKAATAAAKALSEEATND